MTLQRNIADEWLEDEAFMADLNKQVSDVTLKSEIAAIYKAGQRTSLRDGLHVSDCFGRKPCWRRMVLAYYYLQNEVFHKHQLAAIFENGTDIHKRWQEKFQRAGVAIGIEMQHLETFWQVLFTPDIIAMFRGRKTIFELKGYHLTEFNKLAWGGKLPADAILQANLYMHFTGIHHAVIIVECKDNQDFKAWEIDYDPELAKPYEETFDYIKQLTDIHLATGELPVRLAECTAPTDETPKGCGCCQACFTDKVGREALKRPQIWMHNGKTDKTP